MSSDAIEDAKRHFDNLPPSAALDWAARQTDDVRYEITQWSLKRQHDDSVSQADEQKRQAAEAVAATREGTAASKKAVFWAMVSAIISGAGFVVLLLQAKGWLPK